ncbi:MAG: hypothetical protein HZC12_02325 [Nitrospirae bacterium]|nr:hypothetical protein [Nitrospirota bacterium]
MGEGDGKINLFLIWCLTFFICIGSVSFSSADDTVLKVFQINYRNAEELEGVVKPFLSPEGRVVADKRTNSLIVKDYPANIKAIAEFLKEQDRRPQQVKIKIKYVDESNLKRIGLTINWQYRDSHWAVGNIAGDKKGINIDALISAEKGRQQISGEQSLLIMSGSEGRIAVGRSIPYTDWFYWYTRNHGYLTRETRFKDVSTGFVVKPRVIGNNINIAISPQINYGTNEIIYREASTTVICKDGETVLIGSSSSSSENIVWNILGGIQASKGEDNLYIMLTPEIEK